ncbi:MAG: hypothetical protein UY05_C0011G0019 [Candidatus Peregrinibacteria bacterium GW2011_GWA2_47_7]|nr:MAG: hypothetical protein UY05_C0011G0019 [Candidatus Peregrinibacteria bacterium GW2011_GWA2_47_7]
MNEHSIRHQLCPNESCPLFQKQLEGNVVVHSKKQHRFQCKQCKKTWVGHRGETHFGLRHDRQKVERVQLLLKTGLSIRRIATESGLSPNTVQRWKVRFRNSL